MPIRLVARNRAPVLSPTKIGDDFFAPRMRRAVRKFPDPQESVLPKSCVD